MNVMLLLAGSYNENMKTTLARSLSLLALASISLLSSSDSQTILNAMGEMVQSPI